MITDIHGNYTTAPKALESWRNRQLAAISDAASASTQAKHAIFEGNARNFYPRLDTALNAKGR